MPQEPPSRYWIIQHPGSGGDVVAKFDSNTNAKIIPDEIVDHNDFNIVEVSDRSALADKTIDHTGLTETKKTLLKEIYPVQS